MSAEQPVSLSRKNFLMLGGAASLALLIEACAPHAHLPAPTPTKTLIPTATNTETATATGTATSTAAAIETETPVPTPEMTLEDWKAIFTGSFKGDNGRESPLSIVFDENENLVLVDPNEVSKLEVGSQITALLPTGGIMVWVNVDEATEMAKNGAVILVSKYNNVTTNAIYAIDAAGKAWESGNKDIFVQIGESELSGVIYGFDIPINRIPSYKDKNGRTLSAVLRLPKHYQVVVPGINNDLFPEQAGVTDPVYWLDELIKGGYSGISAWPQ